MLSSLYNLLDSVLIKPAGRMQVNETQNKLRKGYGLVACTWGQVALNAVALKKHQWICH